MTDRALLTRLLIVTISIDLALGVILGYRAAAPHPVVVVPGVASEQIVIPGVVPDRSIANFALLFAVNFENYSTATLEAQDRFAAALVAPRFSGSFHKLTSERRAMIREAQMASSFFPRLETLRISNGTISFRARKQQVIGERLSWEGEFDFQIRIERLHLTHSNPYGLAVADYRSEKVHDQ